MSGPAHDDGSQGFTLLEAVAAFAILSLFCIVAFSGISDGLHADRNAAQVQHALLLARSKLAAVALNEPIQPGQTTGRFVESYSWTVTVEPITPADQAWRAYWIEVAVSSAPQSSQNTPSPIVLRTVKLIRRPGDD